MAAPRRRVKVPATVLERAKELAAPAPSTKKAATPAVARQKVIAALKRLKAHPMD